MLEGPTGIRVSDALKRYFGYSSFLPLQEEIIQDILAGRDVFALLPTGGGKSLCYQLPAMVQYGVTLVVSPLISLMKDQVDRLNEKGIPAAFINSTLNYYELQKIMSELSDNHIKLLYVAPERLVLSEFISFLQTLKIDLIAIDEAHCISEWGHEFRPAYRELKLLKERFSDIPIIALTATAIPEVRKDVIGLLKLKDPAIHTSSFNRKNLLYHVRPKADAYGQLLQYLAKHGDESGIIYCFSQKATEDLATKLQTEGFHALPYHAGFDTSIREETQNRFINNEIKIIVATIAFGMGIDKPNIRFVIHYDLPKSLETYCQETGRAGRDGKKSDCILFFGYGDLKKIEYLIDQGGDEGSKLMAHRKLKDMVAFCESPGCRRKILLEYFGETYNEARCDGCDNCLTTEEQIDGTAIARKASSCIVELGERFGTNYVADVLHGSRTKRVINNGHDALLAFGSGKEYSAAQWISFIRELIQRGCLKVEGDRYPVLKMTSAGNEILQGNGSITLTRPKQDAQMRSKGLQENFDANLFECLRNLRRKLAFQEGVPPYIIFHDSSLKDMATRLPRDRSELALVYGVGSKKLESYGDHFLKEIEGYCTRNEVKPSPSEEDLKSNDVEDWFYKYNKWSFARHSLWRKCKLAYYYNYVAPALKHLNEDERERLQKLKELESKDILKGKFIHEIIKKQLDQKLSGLEIDRDDAKLQYARMVNEFRNDARSHIAEYFNGDQVDYAFFDSILAEGFSQIDLFFDEIWPQLSELQCLEHEEFNSFRLEHTDITVKVDFLGRVPDGRLMLFDWKTGSDDLKSEYDLQMASYVLWAAQNYESHPEDICGQFVFLKNGNIKKYIFSNECLDEFKRTISDDFEIMNKTFDVNYFLPSPSFGGCIGCQFSTICGHSMYLNGSGTPEDADDKLLENAFLLKQKIQDLQKQVNDLRDDYNRHIEQAKTSGVTRQGAYKLEKMIRKTRKVEVKAFREAYPNLFLELASVPVSAAEMLVGREAMKELVTYILRESYVITRIDHVDNGD